MMMMMTTTSRANVGIETFIASGWTWVGWWGRCGECRVRVVIVGEGIAGDYGVWRIWSHGCYVGV